MQSKQILGISLTLIGVTGVAVAGCCYLLAFISQSFFVGIAFLTWILFLAGIVVLNDRMSHPAKTSNGESKYKAV